MNEEKLFELLGSLVETNQSFLKQNEEVLRQNAELIRFVKERDAGWAERTTLEIKRLEHDVVVAAFHREEVELSRRALAEFGVDLSQHIKEKVGLQLVTHKSATINAQSDMEYAQEHHEQRLREAEQRKLKDSGK